VDDLLTGELRQSDGQRRVALVHLVDAQSRGISTPALYHNFVSTFARLIATAAIGFAHSGMADARLKILPSRKCSNCTGHIRGAFDHKRVVVAGVQTSQIDASIEAAFEYENLLHWKRA
jgi:hypothetical protein